METATSACPTCHLPVLANFYYCPNCGTALRAGAATSSVGNQIALYVMSFFLGPLVLHLAIKNIRSSDPRTKMSGLISIVIMLFATILGFVLFGSFMQGMSKTLNQLDVGSFSGF